MTRDPFSAVDQLHLPLERSFTSPTGGNTLDIRRDSSRLLVTHAKRRLLNPHMLRGAFSVHTCFTSTLQSGQPQTSRVHIPSLGSSSQGDSLTVRFALGVQQPNS